MLRSFSFLLFLTIAALYAQQPFLLSGHVNFYNQLAGSLEHSYRLIEASNPSAPAIPSNVTFRTLYAHTSQGQFGYFWANTTPLIYEPISRILGFIQHEQLQAANDYPVRLTFRYSTNLGSTWTSQILLTTQNVFYGMPQLGLANPTGTRRADSLALVVTAYKYPAANGYRRDYTSVMPRIDGRLFENLFPGPLVNNGEGYKFGAAKLASFNSGSNRSGFSYCGVLLTPNDQVQYGQYGALVVNARLNDEAEDFISSIPDRWHHSQFRSSPNRTSTYNGPMLSDADQNGNIYAVINALFSDEPNTRLVAFSKSTDMGQSWSTFSRMPKSILDGYASSRGAQTAFVLGPYHQDALTVTGENRFSYIYRLLLADASNNIVAADLVEAEYNDGAWSLRLIAQIHDIPIVYSINDSLVQANNYSQLICDQTLSPLGNEVEVAKTADGTALVVKWIDAVPNNEITINPPQTVRLYDQQGNYLTDTLIRAVPVYSIYLSTRQLTTQGWSEPQALTTDRVFYKGTHIPPIIPALSSIPLLVLRPFDDNQWSTTPYGTLLRNTPDDFLVRIFDVPHNVSYALISAVSNVVQQQSCGKPEMTVNPSPAIETIDVRLSGVDYLTGDLVLVNTLGQEILVYPVQVGVGVHAVQVDISSVPTGVYHMQFRAGGKIHASVRMLVIR